MSKLDRLKELNPNVGKSLRRKFPKKKRVVDHLPEFKKTFCLGQFSEISYIKFYFKDETWAFHRTSLLSGNMKYHFYAIQGYGKEVITKEGKPSSVLPIDSVDADVPSDEEQLDVPKQPDDPKKSDEEKQLEADKIEENKYTRSIRKQMKLFNAKRLPDCKVEFIKGSTTMEFSANDKSVELYATSNPKLFFVIADIEVKRLTENPINYSEVLESLKKGELVAKFSDGSKEVIKEQIDGGRELDDLIDRDIEEILKLRGIDNMSEKELMELLEELKK